MGYAVVGALRAGLLALFLLHLALFQVHGPFRHADDGEELLLQDTLVDHLGHLADIVGELGQQDHVSTPGDARVQREPAGFVAHQLNDHHAAVAVRRGMDAVDHIGGDLHRRMEAESEIRTRDVVINGLWQADDIEPFLRQKRCRLVRAVAAQRDQAVQLHLLVVALHFIDFVKALAVGAAHLAERGAAGPQDGAAARQNIGKLAFLHQAVIALDQAAVPVAYADDLRVKHMVAGPDHAADSGVEPRAVPARC